MRKALLALILGVAAPAAALLSPSQASADWWHNRYYSSYYYSGNGYAGYGSGPFSLPYSTYYGNPNLYRNAFPPGYPYRYVPANGVYNYYYNNPPTYGAYPYPGGR